MAGKSGPWDEKWTITADLDAGGQGTTLIVSPKASPNETAKAVMKILKYPNNPQARARMSQEVPNLKVVHAAGAKVPKVLDSNVDQFEKPEVPLYFVMDHVAGETLDALVKRVGPLEPATSAAICKDLASTVRIGHLNRVLHRDLKPANIIIRDIKQADTFIVDFGLSFNHEKGAENTRLEETFRNELLNLPENQGTGDDQRDFRSDITALVGILYFCITGHYPKELRDSKGDPPHRRAGKGIDQRFAGQAILPQLDSLLTRGFEHDIDNRFQTLSEFEDRLARTVTPSHSSPKRDAAEISGRQLKLLRERNKKVRAIGLRPSAESTVKSIEGILVQLRLTGFAVGTGRGGGALGLPDGLICIPEQSLFANVLLSGGAIANGEDVCNLIYTVGLDGNECVVLRIGPLKGFCDFQIRSANNWERVLSYSGEQLSSADLELLRVDINEAVSSAIEFISRRYS